MTDRLTPEHEAGIAERTPQRAAALTAWLNQFSPVDGDQRALENAEAVLEEDVPALLAELAAVRAERDRYRLAWQAASFRAEARGEGILRITRDRETYQGWLEQEQAAMQQLQARVAELEENLRAVNAGWGAARARVAELEAERHSTNESLSDAAEALREMRDRLAKCERPAIEAKRCEIRSSYVKSIAMAQEDRNYESAFNIERQLREREEQWKREDGEVA